MKVFISSTNEDLKDYRAAARDAVLKANNAPNVEVIPYMQEYWGSNGGLPLDVCLENVRNTDVLVVIVAHRYGWVPENQPNGERKSITWLECEEAKKNGIEIISFIVDENYEWPDEYNDKKQTNLGELDPNLSQEQIFEKFSQVKEKIQLLEKFKAELRNEKYVEEFTNCEDLRGKIEPALLRRFTGQVSQQNDSIPSPPELYAEPKYIGSHKFIGRKAQLEIMNDWAKPSDRHPVLLFEAIGGSGKSMLTWEWITNHAKQARNDWAGRFWYSFYERGAMMTDFCSHALAYMTGQPLEELQKKDNVELKKMVLRELNAHPWLLVLDGIERILVEYHRSDAAHLSDDEADSSEDQIAHRDPTLCIRPEDDEFLRELTGISSSKVLISSRLVPRSFLNNAGQPLPGVRKEILPGLYPPEEAEELLRTCEVVGDSQKMQEYLKKHCDCHPLVTGSVAGLVNNYLPDRGNFDTWADDPEYGGKFDLADLDLKQKRNHILHDAFSGVPDKGCELLYRLAFLSESVDYSILEAFNPHIPPEPVKPEMPSPPIDLNQLRTLILSKRLQYSQEELTKKIQAYEEDLKKFKQETEQLKKDYDTRLEEWRNSSEFRNAPMNLAKTVTDLEQRGLLQYDHHQQKYDLHPVVRSIVFKEAKEDKDGFVSHGEHIIDHFSQQAHVPFKDAKTIQDLSAGIQIIRILLYMEKYEDAYRVYRNSGLDNALCFNLEAYSEELSLLKPFFPEGWDRFPKVLISDSHKFHLANNSAWSLYETGEIKEALNARINALKEANNRSDLYWLFTNLRNMSTILFDMNKFAEENRCLNYAYDLVLLNNFLEDVRVKKDGEDIFMYRCLKFCHLAAIGFWQDAENMWKLINGIAYEKSLGSFRPSHLNYQYALLNFWRGTITEEHFLKVEQLAEAERNHPVIRKIYKLRGEWQIENEQWEKAIDTLNRAVQKSREIGIRDAKVEALRLLAKFHLGQLQEPVQEAETLSYADGSSQRSVAELWFTIGDSEKAKKHALAAYQWAWADGEPFVHRYELNKTFELFDQLNLEIPRHLSNETENVLVPQLEEGIRQTIKESYLKNQTAYDEKVKNLKDIIRELEQEIANQKKSDGLIKGNKTKRTLMVKHHDLWMLNRNFGQPINALNTAKKAITLLKKWTEDEKDPADYYDLACSNAIIYQLLVEEKINIKKTEVPMPNEIMEKAVEYIIESVEAGWEEMEHLKKDKDLSPIRHHPKFIEFEKNLDS
jgi:Domain of unknown function (DUF4062)